MKCQNCKGKIEQDGKRDALGNYHTVCNECKQGWYITKEMYVYSRKKTGLEDYDDQGNDKIHKGSGEIA